MWLPTVLAAVSLLLLQSPAAAKDCYASVGGGNAYIYQYDGKVLATQAKHGIFLLTRSHLRYCHFEIFAKFGRVSRKHNYHGVSRLKAIVINSDGYSFKLLKGRRLSVNGKLQNVPYSQKNIRVFYSGSDLVFVQKKCKFWVAFDGHYTANYRLSSTYRNRVSGLAGYCGKRNSVVKDLRVALKVWVKRGWVIGAKLNTKRRKLYGCHSHSELSSAKRVCARVILGKARCGDSAVMRACVQDYCATRSHPHLQHQLLCANFYLHSRRCAKHNKPTAWRRAAGCTAQCGKNAHFTYALKGCPKTCENHFFGSPKRCFKLAQSEGCTCNRGFVLDGAQCVRPNDCRCLSKLCIDRLSHSKCRHWKVLGRCKKFSNFMSKNCRLTCGLCVPRCKNQVSKILCQKYKKLGKCRNSFYRAMCMATCNPGGCGCPLNKVQVSKCSPKYKNQEVTSRRWWPDRYGKCKMSLVVRYRPCGLCKGYRKVRRGHCNYCKGYRLITVISQYRERYGKKRCIRGKRTIRKLCHCPPKGQKKLVQFRQCKRNVETWQITKTWKPAYGCRRCKRIVRRKLIRRLKCKGIVTVGKCTRNVWKVKQKIYQRVARNCSCKLVLLRVRTIACRCRKPHIRKVCKGSHFAIITKRWSLRGGRCHLKRNTVVARIPCKSNYKSWRSCTRATCKAYKHWRKYHVKNCSCRKWKKTKFLGKCCCPSGYSRTVRINRYWNKLVKVTFKLVNYRCKKIVKIVRIRIACPHGGQSMKCDARRGVKIFIAWKYVKRGNSCLKKIDRTRRRVKCRRNIRRVKGPCKVLIGNVKYRYTKLFYWKRKACGCVQASRTVREMCGCRPGKFRGDIKCPRGCSTKNCNSSRCNYYKIYYTYNAHGTNCRRRVFRKLKFRCCCRPDKRVKSVCKRHKLIVRTLKYTELRAGKCVRVSKVSSKKIVCRLGSSTRWVAHKNKNLRWKVTKIYFRRNCRCGFRQVRRLCKARCRRPKTIKYCDKVRRQKVVRHISWHLVGCKKCVQKINDRRTPVRCRVGLKRWKVCNKKTGVLAWYTLKFYQRGCTCLKKKSVQHLRCGCSKARFTREHCVRNKWQKKETYWQLKNYRCHRYTRIHRRRVHCSSSRRYQTKCYRDSGLKIKFVGVLRSKNCKCVRVWSEYRRLRCNCKRENAKVKNVVKRYCKNNRKVSVRFYYILSQGKCHLKRRVSRRSVRCSKRFVRRLRCDVAQGKQKFVEHKFVLQHCRCVEIKRPFYKSCGCKGKRVIHKQFCKPGRGLVVKIKVIRYWSHAKNTCVSKKETRYHQVSCSRKNHYRYSKCYHNKYYVVRKIYYARRGCSCIRLTKRSRRNCHCKDEVRNYKCPPKGYFRKLVRKIRRWNTKLRKCQIVRMTTRKIRCRCRKNFSREFCRGGVKVKETVKFNLSYGKCRKRIVRKRWPIVCRGRPQYQFTSGTKCYRLKHKLVQRVHATRCVCYYTRVSTQKCKLCCPKPVTVKRCINGKVWLKITTHYSPYTGTKCRSNCRRWQTKRRYRPSCQRRQRLRWLPCNRNTCVSKQELSENVVRGCRCRSRRALTGKRRTCCCSANRRTQIVCINSCLFSKTSHQVLKRGRCVRRREIELVKRWKCRGKVRTVAGSCSRRTCRQKVHDLVSVVDKPHCRCRIVKRNFRLRRCCCSPKRHVTKRCSGNCWHYTEKWLQFKKAKRVCMQRILRNRACPQCSPRRVVRSGCNRRTCRRKITTIFNVLKKCGCHERRSHKSVICCCPRPSSVGPVCVGRGKLVTTYISWKLSHGRCRRRKVQKNRRVACRSGLVRRRVLACNRSNCRQEVRKLYLRLRKCACHKQWVSSHRTCCCRPAVRKWSACVNNTHLYAYKVTRTLNHRRRCVSKARKTLVHVVRRCNNRIKVGRCNPKTRRRIIIQLHRKPRKCSCVTYRISKKHVLCRCPTARVSHSKCNKKICHRKIVKVWYTSHKKGRGVRCQKHRQVRRVRCCCHRQLRVVKICHKASGAIKEVRTWKVFAAKRRVCIPKRTVRVIRRLVCAPRRCTVSRCNRATGYKTKICKYSKAQRSRCNCRNYVKKRRIICACRKGVSRQYCRDDNKLVRVWKYWKISHSSNSCILKVKRRVKSVSCSRRRRIVKKCRGCKGVKTVHFKRLAKCKCHNASTTHRYRCCCPKPTSSRRCSRNRIITIRVSYQLRRGRCSKKVTKKAMAVHCKRRRVQISKCKNCKFNKTVRHYGVRKCRCQLLKTKNYRLRCCCPKKSSRKYCLGSAWLHRTVRYKLRQYRCVRKVTERVRRIHCRETSVHVSKCYRKTNKKRITIKSYSLKQCQCHRKLQVYHQVCRCPPNRVVVKKCVGKSPRAVYKWTYHLRKNSHGKHYCQRKRRLVRREPCSCRNPQRVTRCVEDSVRLTIYTKWVLINVRGRNVCFKKRRQAEHAIECRKTSVTWTKCRRYRKVRVTVLYKLAACRCKKFVLKKVFACNCSKKNSSRKFCDVKTGRIVHVYHIFYSKPKASTCSSKLIRRYVPIRCNRNVTRTLVSRRCGVRKHHGYYSKCRLTWKLRRGCKCANRSKIVWKLCRCRATRIVRKCVLGYKKVQIVIKYVKVNGRCVERRSVARRRVACRSSKAIVTFGGCNRKTCKRSASVRQCFVKNCRLGLYRQDKLQRCCTPAKKVVVKCLPKTGQIATIRTVYYLKAYKALLRDRNGKVLVAQKRVASRTYRTVKNVRCRRAVRRETCNKRTGRWQRVKTYWVRVRCHCVRKVSRRHGKCKCPSPKLRWSRCNGRYKIRTIISFKLRGRRCHRVTNRRKFLCSCQKKHRTVICDGRGRWKTCHISYKLLFKRQRCRKIVKCSSRPHTCSSSTVHQSRCKNYKKLLTITKWRLNKRKCKCVKRVHKRLVGCNCHKRRSRVTRCVRGTYVTSIIKYYLRDEQCVRRVRNIYRPVGCNTRRYSHIIKGSCHRGRRGKHRGYQQVKVKWQQRKNCKCINKFKIVWIPCKCSLMPKYSSRTYRSCSGGSVKVWKFVKYVLKHRKCVRTQRIVKRPVRCHGNRVTLSKCKPNRQGDKFRIVKKFVKVSNGRCGCRWRLRNLGYQICKCRKSRFVKKCLGHKIWRREYWDYVQVKNKSRCAAKVRRQDTPVRCPNSYWRSSDCRGCRKMKIQYRYRHRDCRCVPTKVRTVRLRCCCAKPRTSRNCDARRHVISWVTVSYKLRSGRCVRKKSVRTKRIRCSRKTPIYHIGKCRGRYRSIKLVAFHASACSCVKRVVRKKQRCSCPKAKILRKGKCGRWFATDRWFAYELRKTKRHIAGTTKYLHKCVLVVVSHRRRRCRCPSPIRRRICRHGAIKKISVTFRLKGNSCERKRSVQTKRIGCGNKPRLVRVEKVYKSCSAKRRYVQKLRYIYVKAKGCKCVKFSRVHQYVCNCLLKHGGVHSSKICVGNSLLKFVSKWWENKGRKCVKRSRVRSRRVRCQAKKVRRGSCRSDGIRVYKIYVKYARNCACRWRLHRTVRVPCRCRRSVKTKRCHGNKWVTTVRSWKLVGSGLSVRCAPSVRVIPRIIPCRVGVFVTKTKCNAYGKFRISRTVRKLHNCRCVSKTSHSTCRCRCPTSRNIVKCIRNKIVTVKIAWRKRACQCRGSRSSRTRVVTCPKTSRHVSNCRRDRSGDKYKTVRITRYELANCKCSPRVERRKILCSCAPRRRVRAYCKNGVYKAVKVTRRVVHGGRCVRKVVSQKSRRVRCRPSSVRKICHKKSGILSIIVTKTRVSHCKCLVTASKHTRRCRCHGGTRLINSGKCSRQSCRRRLLYKKEVLRNGKCIWIKFHRFRTCCCRGGSNKRICIARTGVVQTIRIKYLLINYRCVRKVYKSGKRTACSKKRWTLKKKLPDGVLKIQHCRYVRSACSCVRKCKVKFARYSCKKAEKENWCECDEGECKFVHFTQYWVLKNGQCTRRSKFSEKPLRCLPAATRSTNCKIRVKHGWAKEIRKTWWKQRNCKCVKFQRVRLHVCRCRKNYQTKKCHRGAIVRTHVKFSISKNRKSCRRSVTRSRVQIRCNSSWRLSRRYRSGKYWVKIYIRHLLKGCRCAAHKKTVRCLAVCPKCVRKTVCKRNSQLHHITTCWKLRGCSCRSYRRVSVTGVPCPAVAPVRRCNPRTCVKKVVHIRYVHSRCRCVKRKTTVKSRCCCPKPHTNRSCRRGSVRIRTISYRLKRGRCVSKTNDRFVRISCSKRTRRAIAGRCVNAKRKYVVHYWQRKGCRCIPKRRYVFRPCVCAKKAVDLVFAVDMYARNKPSYQKGVTTYISRVLDHFMKTSAKLRTMLLSFNSAVHVSKQLRLRHSGKLRSLGKSLFVHTKTELHKALRHIKTRIFAHTKRQAVRVVVIISCGHHNRRREALKVAAKIKKEAVVFVVQVGKKNTQYLKLLASSPSRYHFLQVTTKQMVTKDHHFHATNLFERICKKACRRSVIKRSRCQRCVRRWTKTSYIRVGHKCQRRVRHWKRACCCLHRGRTFYRCVRNRKFRITVSYSFDLLRHRCVKSVRKIDVSAAIFRRCRPAVSIRRGKCIGQWRKVQKIVKNVVNCACRVRRHTKTHRCACPRPVRTTVCRRGRVWSKCVLSHKLQRGACVARKRCSKVAVVCAKSRKIVSKCKRCNRSIKYVNYSVRGCRCRRSYRVVKIKCCCSKAVKHYSYCDSRKNRTVRKKSWYRLANGRCKRITRRTYHPTICRGPSTVPGKCRSHKGHFYRPVKHISYYARKCLCHRRTRRVWKLCSCRGARITRQCKRGVTIVTKFWWQVRGNRCVPRSTILSRRATTCDTKRRAHRGSCSIKRKTGYYRKVMYSWQKRIGCRCHRVTKHSIKLCRCPRPHTRTSCHRDSKRVITEYGYKLIGGGCKATRRVTYRIVRCPLARTNVSKCVAGKHRVAVTMYRPVNCHCEKKLFERRVSCRGKCGDLLPRRVCKKWAIGRVRLCDRHHHLAAKLCAKTCAYCYGCSSPKLVFSGNHCVSKRYRIAKSSTLANCIKRCHDDRKCRAFEYNKHNGNCQLVSRVAIGRNSSRCLLFRKVCPKSCRFRRVVKKFRCSCKRIDGSRFCYRKVKVAVYSRTVRGKCRKSIRTLLVPCRQCADAIRKCSVKKCHNLRGRKLCRRTCGLCKLKRRVINHRGRCRRGWRHSLTIVQFYDKQLHLWLVRISKSKTRCSKCPGGFYTIVGVCSNGKRKVTAVSSHKVGDKCRVKTRTKVFRCNGCVFPDRQRISKCQRRGGHWRRVVATYFSVRKGRRCIVKRSVREFDCSPKCPLDSSSASSCKCGKRIRCLTYYVFYKETKECVQRTYSQSENCVNTACRDKLSPLECATVKRTGLCKSMKGFCAKTCGFC